MSIFLAYDIINVNTYSQLNYLFSILIISLSYNVWVTKPWIKINMFLPIIPTLSYHDLHRKHILILNAICTTVTSVTVILYPRKGKCWKENPMSVRDWKHLSYQRFYQHSHVFFQDILNFNCKKLPELGGIYKNQTWANVIPGK